MLQRTSNYSVVRALLGNDVHLSDPQSGAGVVMSWWGVPIVFGHGDRFRYFQMPGGEIAIESVEGPSTEGRERS